MFRFCQTETTVNILRFSLTWKWGGSDRTEYSCSKNKLKCGKCRIKYLVELSFKIKETWRVAVAGSLIWCRSETPMTTVLLHKYIWTFKIQMTSVCDCVRVKKNVSRHSGDSHAAAQWDINFRMPPDHLPLEGFISGGAERRMSPQSVVFATRPWISRAWVELSVWFTINVDILIKTMWSHNSFYPKRKAEDARFVLKHSG